MQRGPRVSYGRPGAAEIDRFIGQQRELRLSYEHPAGGVLAPPPGFVVDQRRVELGRGADALDAARDAVRRWRMFDLGWIEIHPPETPIEIGRVVAVLAHFGPLWVMNATRIVDVIDDERRFGFSYGTLPGHSESGEERFLVEQLPDGGVWYDLRAFSQPATWFVRLGYPLARALQRRFAIDSLHAMQRAVEGR